jgi:hypothetical protein
MYKLSFGQHTGQTQTKRTEEKEIINEENARTVRSARGFPPIFSPFKPGIAGVKRASLFVQDVLYFL